MRNRRNRHVLWWKKCVLLPHRDIGGSQVFVAGSLHQRIAVQLDRERQSCLQMFGAWSQEISHYQESILVFTKVIFQAMKSSEQKWTLLGRQTLVNSTAGLHMRLLRERKLMAGPAKWSADSWGFNLCKKPFPLPFWGMGRRFPPPLSNKDVRSKNISMRETGILGAHVPLTLPLHPSLCPLIPLFMKYQIQDKKVTDQGTWGFFFQAEHALYFRPCQTEDQFVAENKVN